MGTSQTPSEEQFIKRIRDLVVSLPYDLKPLFALMADEELPRQARDKAAGGVVYCLLRTDHLPDKQGAIGYVDDVVLLRLLLGEIARLAGDAISPHQERFPEQFEGLAEDEALLHGFLGQHLGWARQRLDKLDRIKYKGRLAHAYVDDEHAAQRLYDDAVEFATEYEVDEHAASKLRHAQEIVEAFSAVPARHA